MPPDDRTTIIPPVGATTIMPAVQPEPDDSYEPFTAAGAPEHEVRLTLPAKPLSRAWYGALVLWCFLVYSVLFVALSAVVKAAWWIWH